MKPDPRHPSAQRGVAVRRVAYAPDARQERHHHDRTSLTLVFSGSLDEVVGGAREEAGPLSVVFKPAGTEHANRIGPHGAGTLQIEFEADFLDGAGPEMPCEWGWAHGGPAARRFLALLSAWSLGAGESVALEDMVFDVLAGLGEIAEDGRTDPPGWLLEVATELDDTFRAPRSVRELAASVAMHPVALARAHRRHFGCSITDRTRFRRVREAAALLDGAESLSTVAYATGFADQPHLTRVFKTETGLTPGVFRTLVRS